MKYLPTLLTAALLASCAGQSGSSLTPTVPSDPSTAQTASAPVTSLETLSSPANQSSTSTDFPGYGGGSAFAAKGYVQVGATTSALFGPLAPASLACDVSNNTSHNSVLTVKALPYVLSSGTGDDVVTSTRTATSGGVVSTSEIQGASVLNGLIRATVVKAEANSSANSGGASSNEAGSQFVGLVVAGTPITVNPAPNTKINLSGLGYVILNEVIGPFNATTGTHITVNMIHVVVNTANTLGIAVGANIVVASASSLFTPTASPYAEGASAYSLLAQGYAGNIDLSSGPWASAAVSCRVGSSSNRLASASTPVGVLGTMLNNVDTTDASTNGSAQATSNTASVNLLKGLITASAIVTSAKVNRTASSFTRSGSAQFVSLKIGGTSIAASPPANTRINLSGLGYVIVNEEVGSTTATSGIEEVTGLLVVVTTSNTYNLPVGAKIAVAHAHAQIIGY